MRSLQDLAVHPPQACKKHRHDKAGRLPDARNRDAIDHHAGIDDPIKLETGPAPIVHGFFEPDARIEKKLPRRAGDDERQRKRIKINWTENPLAADLLIEQDRKCQAECEAKHDIEPAENADVDNRGVPA